MNKEERIREVPEGDEPLNKEAMVHQGPGADHSLRRMMEKDFVDAMEFLAKRSHADTKRKGFWKEGENSMNSTKLALIHSEVSECLEALRHGNPPDDKIPDFSGAEAELADVVIRVMDLAHKNGWRLAEAIVAKIRHNEGREPMHGGKAY